MDFYEVGSPDIGTSLDTTVVDATLMRRKILVHCGF